MHGSNIHVLGTVSQIFVLGLSFDFMYKKKKKNSETLLDLSGYRLSTFINYSRITFSFQLPHITPHHPCLSLNCKDNLISAQSLRQNRLTESHTLKYFERSNSLFLWLDFRLIFTILTSTKMCGCRGCGTSMYCCGLGTEGPWNQPPILSRVLPSVSTSATYSHKTVDL